MKLLVVAPDVNPTGGIGRYSLCALRAAADSFGGSEVGLMALQGGPGLTHARQHASILYEGSSQLTVTSKGAFTLLTILRCAKARPEAILCTHVHLAHLVRLCRAVTGCKYATSAHGLEVWNRLSAVRSWGLLGSDVVLSVSEFTKQKLMSKHRMPERKIRILHSAIDPLLEGQSPRAAASVRHRVGDGPLLLLVGRMASSERYKGHEATIRAMATVKHKVPQARLAIVGDGDDKDRLAQLARSLGLQDCVVFLGHVADSELAHLYRTCRAFVMPCMTEERDGELVGEGFGIVFLEAAAFGKPAIAGRFGASAEAVLDGETGILVDPTDIHDIAQAMERLLEDASYASSLGSRARERVQAEFSYPAFRDQLSATFSEALSATNG